MTREELRDYIDEQRTLNNIPYHVYSALIDGIDTLEQEPRWIPVGERLPERGKVVIVTDIETSDTYQSQYIGDGYWECDNGIFNNRIIAWMPLPEPYSEVKE